jgi:acyl-CoA synthetase (AMP-forming)/AMP-acid ligase II
MRWLQVISHYRSHVSGGPNFAYDLCIRKVTPEQRATLDLSSWRVAFNGAEPVRPTTLVRFAEAFASCGFRPEAFYPCYGLAEATLFVTGGLHDAPPVLRTVDATALAQDRVVVAAEQRDAVQPGAERRIVVGCGRPWVDEQVLIVDLASLTPALPGRVGEIWVRGSSVTGGYWQRPEETQQTFGARLANSGEGPFLRTGDLGFIQDGELFVTGRLKDLIIIDGLNHYPQDIELTVEQSHPAVRPGCSAAFSVEADGQEQLVVIAELLDKERLAVHGMVFTPDAVVRAIRRAVLAQHDLRIHDIVLLKPGAIAKTSSGKIQRRVSRADYLAGALAVWMP